MSDLSETPVSNSPVAVSESAPPVLAATPTVRDAPAASTRAIDADASVSNVPAPQPTPSSLTANVPGRARAWAAYKPFRLTLTLLAILAVGWLLVARLSNGMPDQMVENYGYQYHFKFYTHAMPVTVEGEAALAIKQGVLALGSPTKSSIVTDCSDLGSSWSQAFVATIAGATRPVCSRADGDTYVYSAYFPADGTTHLFTVTYSIPVTQAAKATPNTAKLQAMFNSVRVAPQPQN